MSENGCTRRKFLGLMAASVPGISLVKGVGAAMAGETKNPAGTTEVPPDQPSIGVALGAGGANGLAHILMLEALDEMGIQVARIAGSSIGAIVGSLYAAGMSGKEIRDLVARFVLSDQEEPLSRFFDGRALEWINFVEIELGNGGLVSADGFLAFMSETLKKKAFEELDTPMHIVAGDLWNREQVVLASGDLVSAIKASMAIPGVFEPVRRDGRVLIDGGTCNPVPYDLLTDHCDIVIGIDVTGERTQPASGVPGYFETIFNSVKVMQASIMNEKRRHREPDIYISVPVVDIRALEFYRAREVFEQSNPAKEILKRQLKKAMAQWEAKSDSRGPR
ncbi:MAG: patatin-like phospholipase family protein [Desulfotignum sp.]|nr:patatin-like phospholipase family protein [Desulfotignum sp.]MCF8088343.1 patatin-like phospholipase family protein [Desulfotignum sp.]MCF8136531.1 patatin-like phospholipase family protein [Desulfotignum sp.]